MLQKIQPTLTELEDRVQELLVRIDESEQRNILGAISSILFRAHHDEVSRRRTAGTCEWILKRETFIRWEESDSSVTILYGSPGAGKTFLVSKVVDHSIERAETGEAVAFFYCKRDEENRRNPQDILRSILRQLSSPVKETHRGMIHVAVKDLPNRLALQGTTFDIPICESLIEKLIKDYPRTTIILDALDECDRSTREDLMRVLSNSTNQGSKVRVFISSRHDEDILRHFESKSIMRIQATDNGADISSFVDDKLFQDPRWPNINPEFQEEVKSIFHKKSQGMFQWAALQVDQIRRLRIWSEHNIKEQLEISPTGLKGAYDVVWNQIQEMSLYEEQLARRAFQWALCAFRPLTTSDLLLMMQIDPSTGMMEADVDFTPETIESICGNLLVYDRDLGRWRFSHLSAREYLEIHQYSILESHHHVAISSIKFLQRSLIQVPLNKQSIIGPQPPHWAIAPSPSDPGDTRFQHTFRSRHSELPNLLRNLFEPISQGSPSFKGWKSLSCASESARYRMRRHRMTRCSMRRRRKPEYKSPLQLSSTPLQVMSIYGLFHILGDLWEKAGGELDACPMSTPSPLTLAIICGHQSIWKFILLGKVNVNNGAPGPLVAAIQCDNMKAFEALLEAKADVNYIHPYKSQVVLEGSELTRVDTPLQAALLHPGKQSRRYFLQRLLDRGADVNLNTGTRTSLELAVLRNDEECVRILLDANAEVYNPDHLLSLAARNPNFNLAPLFLSLGASIEKPFEGILPLVWALREGNLSTVQFLLEMSDISIDLSCQDYREAILSAMGGPTGWDIFPFLFGSNSYINWRLCGSDTIRKALSSYAKYEYELHGLGLSGPSFALKCIKGAAHRLLSLVDTLLNAGSDPSVRVDFGPGTTLTAAAFHGTLHYVRALLDEETIGRGQEKRALFRTALFVMMSGHLGTASRKSPDRQSKPFSNECLCPKYLKVLLRLFEGDLSAYMPIYDFLDPLIPLVCINGEGYEIDDSCRLYVEGYFGCLSRLWFSIMWDLQNSASPQLPLRSQLRRWRFPATLPPTVTIVARLTAFSSARPNYLIRVSLHGHHSQFIIVRGHMKVRRALSDISDDKRWKKYKPESFGVIRYSNHDLGVEISNTEVAGASRKVEASLDSLRGNSMVWIFLALIIGLFCYFFALLLSTRET
ncbi:hypothetical protein FPRO06_07847 [Fusarium proliferatum]|nr:hypothetical protein FPRO06_07847 [Fusarium proliferatum]